MRCDATEKQVEKIARIMINSKKITEKNTVERANVQINEGKLLNTL